MKSDKAPKVTSIDSFSIKAEIKKCPINVQQYISALERALERQKDVTNKAIKKIKEISKSHPTDE